MTAIFLLLMSFAVGGLGYVVWSGAQSSIHQIAALILFLHSDILFCAAAIVSTLNQSQRRTAKQLKMLQSEIAKRSGEGPRLAADRLAQVTE